MVIIMFFNSKYNCKATSAVPGGPSACCTAEAGPKAKLRACVQSNVCAPAGFSSPDSCLHCHKEGQKKGSREGVAWKGSKCIMCLMISAAVVSEGSAREGGTDDGAGVGQHLLKDYFLCQSQQQGILSDGLRGFSRAAQGMRMGKS